MSALLQKRFDELVQQLHAVAATKHVQSTGLRDRAEFVDDDLLLNWRVKARSLLGTACGKDSEHYKSFAIAEEGTTFSTNFDILNKLRAVFLAAKEDFEGGYLSSIRALVEAEIAGGEIEQARELLDGGYCGPAAVVCGVVLENALRALCDRKGVPHAKADRMNADLAKIGQYNSLIQKRITSLLAIRNSAAHGKNSEFTADDVRAMTSDVERLVADWSEP